MRPAATLLSLLVLLTPATALAQTTPPGALPPESFPAWLGYAALGVFAGAGTILSGAIAKLYFGQRENDKAAQARIDEVRKDAATLRDADRRDCAQEVDRLRNQLEQEQRERRIDTEKLLREQKDIFKEVMTTCGSIGGAMDRNTVALEKLRGN